MATLAGIPIKLKKPEGGSKSKKWRQTMHHKETHKYEKQVLRTVKNKVKHINAARDAKEQADARRKQHGRLHPDSDAAAVVGSNKPDSVPDSKTAEQ